MPAIYFSRSFAIFIVILTLFSCKCIKKNQLPPEVGDSTVIRSMALPPTLVYRTNKDYFRYVPVNMNAEKTIIVSYPAPTDVFFKGSLAYPTPLEKGYLLDNRGIGPNVAFLDYSYETYAAMEEVPDRNTLLAHILDKNPIRELWDCGPRTGKKNEVERLNGLIANGFPGCRQLVNRSITLEQ